MKIEAAEVQGAGESEPPSITKKRNPWGIEYGRQRENGEEKKETESVEINKDTAAVSSNNVMFFSNCVLVVLTFSRSVRTDYPYATGPI